MYVSVVKIFISMQRKGKRLMGFKFRQIDVPHRINEKQKKMCMSSKYKIFIQENELF